MRALWTVDIARVCHEVNRAYCESIGDMTQLPWESAPEWQKKSVTNGVVLYLDNPELTPEDLHNSWLKEKKETGWKYGEVKDEKLKTHPCMVPYNELPQAQRSKDYIFSAVVDALREDY